MFSGSCAVDLLILVSRIAPGPLMKQRMVCWVSKNSVLAVDAFMRDTRPPAVTSLGVLHQRQ